jgi:hypothetical protein
VNWQPVVVHHNGIVWDVLTLEIFAGSWRRLLAVGAIEEPQFALARRRQVTVGNTGDVRMGVAGWWNGLSDNFTDLVAPVADLQDLYGFELYYNYQINKWMHLSPDIQLVQNEWKDDDMAVIFGVRLVIDL